MFYFMIEALSNPNTGLYLKIWLYYVSITVTISLLLDTFNLLQFVRGDKSEIG